MSDINVNIEAGTSRRLLTAGKYCDNDIVVTASTNSPTLQEKTVSPATSSQSVTPDSGYDGLSKVTVNAMPTATQATPSITVSSAGLITASATQSAGYVAAGTKSATKQLTTQAAKTITPSTSSQTAVASGVYTTGAVTVGAIPSTYVKPTSTKTATTYTPGTSNQTIAAGTYCSGAQTIKGDANLKAENIKSGVSIFGVTGTHSGGGGSGGGSVGMCTIHLKTPALCSGSVESDANLLYCLYITYENDKYSIVRNDRSDINVTADGYYVITNVVCGTKCYFYLDNTIPVTRWSMVASGGITDLIVNNLKQLITVMAPTSSGTIGTIAPTKVDDGNHGLPEI